MNLSRAINLAGGPRGRRAQRPGFTLVELLIVVAILGILLAMLLPLGSWAIARARILQCQSNLRELGICLKQYYQDWGGTFPPQQSTVRPERQLKEMAEASGLILSPNPMSGGYHWSIILWPYHHSLKLYACPCDPHLDQDDGIVAAPNGSPFQDAPAESYGLNTLLFRSMPALRKQAGASWGLTTGEFQSSLTYTTFNDQKRTISQLDNRIVMFCGTSGFPVGHQSNVAWRDSGLAERYEWHPWPGPKAFEDGDGYGSVYLFFDGRAEYRESFPSRFEWALDLK
jgi:prepilin-type N-terminal cleavage/methylation domain-containing protein